MPVDKQKYSYINDLKLIFPYGHVPLVQAPRIVYKGVCMSTVVNIIVFELYCVY